MVHIDHLLNLIRETNGRTLYPYQVPFAWAILESVFNCRGKEIKAHWARQIGKSEILAAVSYFLTTTINTVYEHPAYPEGIKLGIFAPKKDQADSE